MLKQAHRYTYRVDDRDHVLELALDVVGAAATAALAAPSPVYDVDGAVFCSSGRTSSQVKWSAVVPYTRTSGGSSPPRPQAMGVPSLEATVSMPCIIVPPLVLFLVDGLVGLTMSESLLRAVRQLLLLTERLARCRG
jgi:hypothetical protein